MPCQHLTVTKELTRPAGLEPVANFRLLPIGALPLWRRSPRLAPVTPTTWENSFPTPFEVRILP